jgi:DNA-binding MarR family transcriptional regulator
MKDMRFTIEDPFGKFVHLTERFLLKRLQRNFRVAGYSITAEQWHVLINLWEQDGQTQQQLSEKTEKDKGNITRLINGLERRNILVRIPNYTDRRSKLIYLTSKGKDYQKALIQIAQKTLNQAQANITKNEIELCNSVLQRVVNNLRD